MRTSLFFVAFCINLVAFSQTKTISGAIYDNKGETLPSVSILERGTNNGTASDLNGNFELIVKQLPTVLVISYVGYKTKEVNVSGSTSTIKVTLQGGISLGEVVFVGTRSKPRTAIKSPVPIDNIGIEELARTGQPTVDKMLTYKIPSFNSSNQAISDATAHFDPADLRGLGPSRTLVLVNGKRKNQSALVYINDTPGKGEVGVDLKSIPQVAIERIEVLRDGASAQYGSDAIAGVINMVLKKNVGVTSIDVKSGITTQGDGFYLGADINRGFSLGKNGGFLNLSAGYYGQEKTDRAGEPGEERALGENEKDFERINSTYSDWIRRNPDLGTIVGQPEIKKGHFFANFGIPFANENGKFYGFGGTTYREGTSFALYRPPYTVPDPFNLLHKAGTEYQGFQARFEPKIWDNNATIGVKFKTFDFNVDLSGTYGRNSVEYMVNNSINPSLKADSPTSFDVGGYVFSNLLSNLDISRNFGKFNLAFGAEARRENFIANAGEVASYYRGASNDGLHNGTVTFPGLRPENEVDEIRFNIGVYTDIEWEPISDFLIGGAVRFENFDDFGNNISWKINSRYLLAEEKVAIRASYSTGFRAPSLHQIYLSNIQTLITTGGGLSNQGTFNNVSPIIRDGLGVPQLTAEISKNISVGITYKPESNISISLDAYDVRVNDRVLFSGAIEDIDTLTIDPVDRILNDFNVESIKFFINAVNTETYGADLVANVKNIELGSGKFEATLAANLNKTEIKGEIDAPEILANNGYEIFDRKEQSRIISARPRSKILLGLTYDISDFTITLNNTYFGEVTWQHATDPNNDQTFSGKVITDLNVNYAFTEKISAFLGANNLFNIFPDEIDPKGDVGTNVGGRFRYPWEVNQFGFSGTIINTGIRAKF